jgi:glyoxylase-like metal-dependent hydrolase (beta-lactamase superfamily II)
VGGAAAEQAHSGPGPDVELLVAPNPGPMTLEGTNTYVVGRDPATVIDPGPADEGHIEAVRAAAAARGGIGAVLLTHSHGDHSAGVPLLGTAATELADGEAASGITAMATPGHAADHLCFLIAPGHRAAPDAAGTICFSGDLILGEGSTIVPPGEQGGSLADYMASLARLAELDLELIYPGHGPVIADPGAKIAEYISHREAREERLLEALSRGERSRLRLLEQVWDDVPAELLPMAAFAMQAHLDKLDAEGRLPGDLAE